jgi:hypothetical protein
MSNNNQTPLIQIREFMPFEALRADFYIKCAKILKICWPEIWASPSSYIFTPDSDGKKKQVLSPFYTHGDRLP